MISEVQDLDGLGRAWLGIVAATLLHPRLMSQDLLMLGPGMIAVTAAGAAIAPGMGTLLRRLTMGICVLVLILTVAGGRLGQTAAVIGFSGLFLWIGALHIPRARQALE
ncbi:MAG: hypothetical protein CGW95_05360, partial [Phenylobacterium zucineum]